ncbi:hypothetical protein C7271_26840 [filamentous cyanobacterium CCP5]|nr:hypothetical protein C7271_26840 [filamentous cyanobacterium CCP5]
MKLPNPNLTVIDESKLTGYCLNMSHSDGRNKARVFQAALGLTQDNAEELRAALLQAVEAYEAIPAKRNRYGQKYVIDFPLERSLQVAIVHSVWIVRDDETFPRLVTCYVL